MRRLDVYFFSALGSLIITGAAVLFAPLAPCPRAYLVTGARVAAAAVAVVCAARGFFVVKRAVKLRPSWVFFGLGLGGLFTAEVLDVLSLSWPRLATAYDYILTVCFFILIISTTLKVRSRPAVRNLEAVVGAVGVAGAAFLLVVNLLVIPALRAPESTALEKVIALLLAAGVYGAGSLALVVVSLVGPYGFARPWVYAALGLLFFCLGELIRQYLVVWGIAAAGGDVVTMLLAMAGYYLIGMGVYYKQLIVTGVVAAPGELVNRGAGEEER